MDVVDGFGRGDNTVKVLYLPTYLLTFLVYIRALMEELLVLFS